MLCPYRHALGRPREGVHALRVFDVAVVDVVLTLVAAYVLSRVSGWRVLTCAILLCVIGIIAHRVFCVDTAVDRILFR